MTMEPGPSRHSPIGLKRCASTKHEQASNKFPKLSGELTSVGNRKKLSYDIKKFIINERWISSKSDRISNICMSCISLAEEECGKPSSSSPGTALEIEADPDFQKDTSKLYDIQSVIADIKSKSLPESVMMEIAAAIGQADQTAFREIGNTKMKEDKKSILLNASYSSTWKNYGCKYFKSYLNGVCDVGVSMENQKRVERHFVSAANNIAMAVNPRFISPLSLAQNVVLHSYTGSRTVSKMFGVVQPSGSYSYLTDFVRELSFDSPKFPTGDIFVVFDNQQIVGRDFRVSVGSTQPTSTVTQLAVYQEDVQMNMQYNNIPCFLSIADLNPTNLWTKYLQQEQHFKSLHNQYRDKWIENRLAIVERELDINDGDLQNEEVKKITFSEEYNRGLNYDRVPIFNSSCKVYDMENLLLNPNSYESVAKVLTTILEMSDITSPDRKWITCVCDGVPYSIGTKLVKEFMECKTCGTSGRNLKCGVTEGHTTTLKFSRIVMRPGAGHIELNLVRAIFKGFFDVFIKPIAIRLGFATPSALEYCKKALDHHKSWQILQIVFVSLSDEILRQYVIPAKAACNSRSPGEFSMWMATQKCPNLRMASDFVFNILHPLFLFRAGIRQCNDNVAMAGLHLVSSVFFGFNHPNYRYITANDSFYLLTLPDFGAGPAKRFGFRVSKSGTAQGLDFLLEERNKLQKQWIFSHGVPSAEQWKKSSSTLSFFEHLKSGVLTQLGIEEEGWTARHIPLGAPLYMARVYFREVIENFSSELTTFCDERTSLPNSFRNCAFTCKDNKYKFMQAFLKQEKCVLNLVDSTELESLSLDDLKKRTTSKVRQLVGSSKVNMNDKLQHCGTAADFIELIGEIEEEISKFDYSFS